METAARAAKVHLEAQAWPEMALVNIARSGIISRDRSISEYAGDIWQA